MGGLETQWYRESAASLYDPFEPNYLKSALSDPEINLGGLIFGSNHWSFLGGSVPKTADPLTAMFKERGKHSVFISVT